MCYYILNKAKEAAFAAFIMKTGRPYPIAVITAKNAASAADGHPWIYEDEIMSFDGAPNGSLVDCVTESGAYIGTGLLSASSKIRIRLISTNANDRFDESFFERRIKWAVDYRKTVLCGDISSCRLIFGEADWLPGLTVDKYGDILVIQTMSYGMEQRKNVVFPLIVKVLEASGEKINGIFERNDSELRLHEGLEPFKGWYGDDHPVETVTWIVENGIKYNVDFENGQKTGYFLDQRFNRLEVMHMAGGRNVLDCCTHTGSFALNACKGGAASVTALDISDDALTSAKENAALNDMSDRISFIKADIFDYLPSLGSEKKKPFDLIVLDPPAFTKSRKTVFDAARGYTEINSCAMKALPRGGYLATCSCSHFLDEKMFVKMLISASKYAGVNLRLIKACAQSPDHPRLMSIPETYYLKFYLLQVI